MYNPQGMGKVLVSIGFSLMQTLRQEFDCKHCIWEAIPAPVREREVRTGREERQYRVQWRAGYCPAQLGLSPTGDFWEAV